MTTLLALMMMFTVSALHAEELLSKEAIEQLRSRCFVWKPENCRPGHAKADRRLSGAVLKKATAAEAASAISKRGWTLLMRRDYLPALKIFNQALLIDDKRMDAYLGAATAYYQLQLYPDAEALLDKAVVKDPKLGDAFMLQSRVKLALKKLPAAELAYRSAVELGVPADAELEAQLPKKTKP